MKRVHRRIVLVAVTITVLLAAGGATRIVWARTTSRVHTAAPRVVERWRWTSPAAGDLGLPAVDRAGVVVTQGGEAVVALTGDGRAAWRAPFDGARPNPPVLDRALVFVAGEDEVVALDRRTGTRIWAASIDGGRANRPVVVGDQLVATTWDGRAYAFDRTTGARRWSVDLPTESLSEPPGGMGLVVAAIDAGWVGLDAATGKQLWQDELYPVGESSPVVFGTAAAPRAAIASGGVVEAVNARTGEALWHDSTGVGSESLQVPSVRPGARPELVVPDHRGGATAYAAATGRRLWRTDGHNAIAEVGQVALLPGGVVALAMDDGGPRLAWNGGRMDLHPPGLGRGVAVRPPGLVVSTWQAERNVVVAYRIEMGTRAPRR